MDCLKPTEEKERVKKVTLNFGNFNADTSRNHPTINRLLQISSAYLTSIPYFQFQEAEKKRYRAEQQRFEMKHQRQLEEARASSQSAIKELEQMQNEKRKMLMEHETQKLKELDEEYAKDLKEWKAHLKPRKQVTNYIQFNLSSWPLSVPTLSATLLDVFNYLTRRIQKVIQVAFILYSNHHIK